MKTKEAKVAVSTLKLEITTGLMGAPTLTLALHDHSNRVHGVGRLFQAVNPPLDNKYNISGVSNISIIGRDLENIISFSGTSKIKWNGGGVGPVMPVILKGTVMLSSDENLATYSYMNNDGNWIEVSKVPVKVIK